jgi:hypothetical protein
MSVERRLAVLGAGVTLGLAALAGGASLAGGAETVRAPRAFTVQLLSRNGSDMTGTVRFVPRGKRSFWALVRVSGGPGAPSTGYPAHVHTGPCSIEPTFERPRIYDGLNNVINGRSRTTVHHSLGRYRRGKFSVNVHEPNGVLRPMACGDLPRRF